MTLTSLANFPLSLILQPVRPQFAPGSASHSDNVVAAVNGLGKASAENALATNSSDDLFSVKIVDVNKLKVDLIDRLSKALGVKQEDYDTSRSFGFALKMAVIELKSKPEGRMLLLELEKDLGLDKLGISIDTLINAIIDPSGDDGEKLDAALGKQLGEANQQRAIELDEIGIYRPVR